MKVLELSSAAGSKGLFNFHILLAQDMEQADHYSKQETPSRLPSAEIASSSLAVSTTAARACASQSPARPLPCR